MSKRITYYLGAGASYFACPIWREQGEMMVELARYFLPNDDDFLNIDSTGFETDRDKMIHAIGFFGKKALEYNTLDAYARKLYLNESYDELNNLKFSLSAFFTIWQFAKNGQIKSFKLAENRFTALDKRYINLLSICLEKGQASNLLKLNDNIRFVSWNYDLQLELTYKAFLKDDVTLEYFDKEFGFIPQIDKPEKQLSVCHLNGFHGFYHSFINGHRNFIDKYKSLPIEKIVNELVDFYSACQKRQCSFDQYINYAWEKKLNGNSSLPLSEIARSQAKKIFSQTDTLVIIGYSFPPFNREIDRELFASGESTITKVIYQDPNASVEYIAEAFDYRKDIIEIQKDNLEQFVLPSLF
jgi:hypothetical protein